MRPLLGLHQTPSSDSIRIAGFHPFRELLGTEPLEIILFWRVGVPRQVRSGVRYRPAWVICPAWDTLEYDDHVGTER